MVVAVPPRAIADVVGESLQSYPSATVTDVGSVKAGVLDALWERPVDLTRYVGSHPMAGSHHSGPVTADGDLFVDRTWVVTPHRKSAEASVEDVVALVRACRARLVTLDVDDHDAAVARVSHLPHLVSVLMAGHLTTVPGEDLVLAGQGLRDVTRIAGSDPGLWQQIVGANATAVLRELLAGMPVGQASRPIVSNDGVAVLMVCSREQKNIAEPTKEEVSNRLLQERVELTSRQLQRDLRRRAVLDERA